MKTNCWICGCELTPDNHYKNSTQFSPPCKDCNKEYAAVIAARRMGRSKLKAKIEKMSARLELLETTRDNIDLKPKEIMKIYMGEK